MRFTRRIPAYATAFVGPRAGLGAPLASWLIVVACTSGCVSMETRSRGTVIAHDELLRNRDHLPQLVADDADRGLAARAFYAHEVNKSRFFAGISGAPRTGTAREALPPVFRDVERNFAPQTTVATAGGPTRGLTMLAAKEPDQLQRQAKQDDEAFWIEQRKTDERLESIGKRNLPYQLALAGRFVISTAEEVQRGLAKHQLLISFAVVGDAVYAFRVGRGGMRAQRLRQPAAVLRQWTTELVVAVRQARGDDWRALAKRMWLGLFEPFAAEMATAKIVTLVPDGFLANVPFAVLIAPSGQLLVEQAAIGYLPSASFYRALLARPLFAEKPRMLVLGNAIYPQPWQPLPTAETEARSVARVFDGSTLLIGREATEERFVDAIDNHNIFHFATHGMLAGQLAAQASSLLLTRTDEADGYLTAAELARLDLSRSYLAVLSACETSVSTDGGGSLDSISAAFLSAGAPTVIGSQWQVSDDSTAALMVDFYAHFLDVGAAEALRAAQLRLRENKAWQHPFFWAAFVLYGWDK